jgi:hypothetical protein
MALTGRICEWASDSIWSVVFCPRNDTGEIANAIYAWMAGNLTKKICRPGLLEVDDAKGSNPPSAAS